ncbi:hypothetical protein [Burkholderia ubonensis]|uniref:hypothetical protein n=1 Tax=Burkholderia ubonensis TaxID=101571 RepID=UPI000AD69E49|nr:hypothetical protein [Burkholderia ubonensis]
MKLYSAMFCFFVVILLAPERTMAGSMPFNMDGIEKIKGKSICDFSGAFYKKLGVVVGGKGDYSVEYLARDGYTGIFLLKGGASPDYCGTVLDSRVVISKNPEDVVLFKCGIEGEPYKGWGYVVGTGDNHQGHLRYVSASMAWRVDTRHGRFFEIKDRKVICDATGYVG